MQCLSYKEKRYVIIVAAGRGVRLKSDIPKQFLPINGKPILMHTIEKIVSAIEDIKPIVVISKEYIPYWEHLIKEYNFTIAHNVVQGGKERFFSVQNALETIEDYDAIVGLHDGVRPFVSRKVIEDCFSIAEEKGNCIPYITPKETTRLRTKKGETKTINRDDVFLIQTPQCFDVKMIKEAYKQEYQENFTDDASVVEKMGEEIFLTKGNIENIKITNPIDILYSEILINEFKD
ncbi:MAG: 2-C-methyl-D-erythritol 4-phosphate cytidylyltransferase [Bacteroidales bacterium]|jgi:2-C-methyl-D-erythritol 4-phosphate cytidylyltransferase|nr:2-C-methyl-D-erythritol 4-phosphate cytidylyltransferase [Bacteroidales bacterium]